MMCYNGVHDRRKEATEESDFDETSEDLYWSGSGAIHSSRNKLGLSRPNFDAKGAPLPYVGTACGTYSTSIVSLCKYIFK